MFMKTFISAYRQMQGSLGKFAYLAVTMVLALSCPPAAALEPMTEAEYVMLPEYCKAQGNVSDRYFQKHGRADRVQQWKAALGSNHQHYHHFCWAIVSIARAYKGSSTYGSRNSLALRAIHDIEYVLDRATPDLILLPEIYTKLGEAYLLAGDDRNAEAAFRKAWETNPAYWRPYVWWAQRLMQLGKMQEARAVAEEGQKNAPGVKALDDLIKDIGAPRKNSSKK